jgi:hypothetical protein
MPPTMAAVKTKESPRIFCFPFRRKESPI